MDGNGFGSIGMGNDLIIEAGLRLKKRLFVGAVLTLLIGAALTLITGGSIGVADGTLKVFGKFDLNVKSVALPVVCIIVASILFIKASTLVVEIDDNGKKKRVAIMKMGFRVKEDNNSNRSS